MKTIIIDGDVWFMGKLVGLLYNENKEELTVKSIIQEEETIYNNFPEEDFEALKFELANQK